MTAAETLSVRWPRAGRTVGLGPLSVRVELRTLLVSLLLVVGIAVVTLTALRLGDYVLGVGEVFEAVFGAEDSIYRTIVVEWRAPRALAAVVFGSALAVSGGVFQSLTRNPLASPDIIGFSAGSYSGALIMLVLVGGGYLQVAAGAMVGGLGTALAVYLLAHRKGMQGFRLIIVGVAISAMLASANSYLMLTARLERAMQAAVWGAGSLAPVTLTSLAAATVLIAIILLGLGVVIGSVRELELGEDLAVAHGVRSRPVWIIAVVLGVGLTAVVTATSGPIAFVALAAPQIARRITGGGAIGFGTAALVGAFLVSSADLAAQHLFPIPLPVGLVTVVIGGAYLIWLILAESGKRRQP